MTTDLGSQILSLECFPLIALRWEGANTAIRIEMIEAREALESLIDVIDDAVMEGPNGSR